jgi:hypothetical protein
MLIQIVVKKIQISKYIYKIAQIMINLYYRYSYLKK